MALGFRLRSSLRLPALVGLLALCGTVALAGELSPDGQAARCHQIGQFARAVALERDAGTPKGEVLAKLPKGDSPARRTVEGIYRDRQVTPDQAAGMELTCLLDAARPASSPR